jgi:hypothetical protein
MNAGQGGIWTARRKMAGVGLLARLGALLTGEPTRALTPRRAAPTSKRASDSGGGHLLPGGVLLLPSGEARLFVRELPRQAGSRTAFASWLESYRLALERLPGGAEPVASDLVSPRGTWRIRYALWSPSGNVPRLADAARRLGRHLAAVGVCLEPVTGKEATALAGAWRPLSPGGEMIFTTEFDGEAWRFRWRRGSVAVARIGATSGGAANLALLEGTPRRELGRPEATTPRRSGPR